MRKLFLHKYEEVVSLENLLEAWRDFVRGKRNRTDAIAFESQLMEHLVVLHYRLLYGSYRHGSYEAFTVTDPKVRQIHKASVTDRVLHRALYRKLYPFFDRTFIADSFSCRMGKGTHKALDRFRRFAWQVSHNHRRTVWVLKCDVRKFFASIDHGVLLRLLEMHIMDKRIVWLLTNIVRSFESTFGRGLPLGNLTSQLFANIYMNEFDQYVKHQLKIRHYIRYADDFVLLSDNEQQLKQLLPVLRDFLRLHLCLELHPNKIELRTFASGVDFLGWVHFVDHRLLRPATRRRMERAVDGSRESSVVASYRGLLSHGNTEKVLRKCFTRYTSP